MVPFDPLSRLRVHLQAAERLLAAVEARVVRERTGAGRSDFGVLGCLAEAGPLSVSEVGRKLHLTSGAATSVIDRAERRGWVERRRRRADRRTVTVELTAEGRAVFERIDPEVRSGLVALFSGLSEVERAQLARLLEKLTSGDETEPIPEGIQPNYAESGLSGVIRR